MSLFGEPLPVPLEAQIAVAERELRMRERVYPRWVQAKRMTQHEADAEMAGMRAIARTLRGLQEAGALQAQLERQERAAEFDRRTEPAP